MTCRVPSIMGPILFFTVYNTYTYIYIYWGLSHQINIYIYIYILYVYRAADIPYIGNYNWLSHGHLFFTKDFQRSQTPFQETKDDGGAHRSGGFRPYQNGGLWVMSEWSETLGSGHSHGPQWSVGVWYVWCCTSLESSLGPSLQQFGLAQHETNFEEMAGSQAGHGPQKNPGYVVSQYPSWWSEPWVNCHLVCHRNSAWNQWTCQAYMRCKLCPVAYPGFVEEEWHPIRPSQLANDVQFLPVCIGSSKKRQRRNLCTSSIHVHQQAWQS